MDMMNAVIFDWGGVIIDDPRNELVKECATYLEVSPEAFAQAYAKVDTGLMLGRLPIEGAWYLVCQSLSIEGVRSKKPYLGEAFAKVYQEKQETLDLIAELRRAQHKIGLLSNTEMYAIQNFDQRRYTMFDAAIFSCVEGIAKPNEAIYRIALDRLHVAPSNAYFIDNHLPHVEAAQKIGIHGIHFISPEQVRQELSDLLQPQ